MALELSIEMGAKAEEGWARRLLGSSYRLDGDLMKAEEYLDQAFAIFTETGEAEEVAKTHMDYGNLYKAMGKPGDARKAFEKALEMFEEMGIRAGAERIRKELEEVEEP